METFLAFTVVGIVTGAIYAVAASGLVVTYTTSGIFNFAHGAIGMFMAFVYWQLRVHRHVAGPALALVARAVRPRPAARRPHRPGHHAAPARRVDRGHQIVVTIGLLFALHRLAP